MDEKSQYDWTSLIKQYVKSEIRKEKLEKDISAYDNLQEKIASDRPQMRIDCPKCNSTMLLIENDVGFNTHNIKEYNLGYRCSCCDTLVNLTFQNSIPSELRWFSDFKKIDLD